MQTKKVDLLNELAVISDLIEKLDADVKSPSVIFEVSKVEFERIYDFIESKYGTRSQINTNTFTIKIGNTEFVFNTNSV
jgi:hypothetical protein